MEALQSPAATTVMSVVVLTAVLSALNSGLFAASRMLMALARRGDAPSVFSRLDRRGVPVAAILASTAFGYLTVIMSYVSPDRVFAFLVNSYGTVAIFVYLLIACAELKLRRRLEREAPSRLRVRMWGYPWLTRLTIAGMLAIVAAMGVIREQRVALLFGVVSAAVLLGAFVLRRRALLRFTIQREGALR
jgi:GABA permease